MLFTEACAELFSASGQPGRRLYLLVDTAVWPALEFPKALGWSGTCVDLLTLSAPQWGRTAAPVLMEAPRLPFDALLLARWRQLASQLQYANALTLIESDRTIDALAKALAERLRVQLADGTTMLLRLFDNRVLAALLVVLDPAQLDALLAPGASWRFAGRDGTIYLAAKPQESESAAARRGRRDVLRLKTSQEDKLLEMSEPDSIVGLLLQQQNPQLMAMRPDEQHATVAAHLSAADRWQIEQTPARASFVALGLQLGEGFDRQPPWEARLDAARARRQPFLSVLAEALEQT